MNPKSLNNLKPFAYGVDDRRGKGGRKPSLLKKYMKEQNVSKQDIQLVFSNIIFGKSKGELKQLLSKNQGDDLPAIVYGIVKAFLADTVRGQSYTINMLLIWMFDKPGQPISMSGGLGVNQMSPEELDTAIKKYIEGLGYVKTDNSTGAGNTGTGNTD